MAFSIARETALQDDVRDMVAELNAFLNPLSPPQFQFQMTAEQMAGADTYVFVVRDAALVAVGMGSLKVHTSEFGELKRMFTRPTVRGSGLGRLIVQTLEAHARSLGVVHLKLETGAEISMPEAHRLYTRCGYRPCSAFLDYPESDYSRFYEKDLTADKAA